MPENKRVKNYTLPSTPVFEMVVGPAAALMVGKAARIADGKVVNCAFEAEYGEGSENENLTMKTLPPGQIGFITGVTGVKTVLKFLVMEEENGVKPGVYHVKFIDLEQLNPTEEQPQGNNNG